jgi:pyridoxine 5'-phosphate synthase PdxJ
MRFPAETRKRQQDDRRHPMSRNDICIVREVHREDFNVYHADMDEWLEMGRTGRPIARHLSLREAVVVAQAEGTEYGLQVDFLRAAVLPKEGR